MMKLQGALPSGSLQQPCLELWRSAGYRITVPDRSFFPQIDDPEMELLLLRPQEIPRYVAGGKLDFGICGYDCMVECACEERVVTMAEFTFSKVSRNPTTWVLAVPNGSAIAQVSDLAAKTIATEFVTMTRRWLQDLAIEATVEFSWGTTEVKPGRFCDAIVEATETGNSLRKNGLRIIGEVLKSTPRFIASPQAFADPWKKQKMQDIALLLRATLDAEGKVELSMNAKRSDCYAIVAILPALQKPTMSSLSDPDWVEIRSIVDETVVRQIIPTLKRAGAEGIVEHPMNKLIL